MSGLWVGTAPTAPTPAVKIPSTVFYSWQAGTLPACNRSLIESALENVIDRITKDTACAFAPTLEQDARNSPGAPDIHQEIFDKISRASVVIADVTMIGNLNDRPCPNPNVLIEVGYALAALSYKRIILVQNTHFGGPEALPFDLRPKSIMTYSNAPDATDRASARKLLEGKLEPALRTILAMPGKPTAPIELLVTHKVDKQQSDYHHYTLKAEIENVSKRRLTDWQIEVFLPKQYRDGTVYAVETESGDPRRSRYLVDSARTVQ